ncbi:MAG: RNA polymerase sigma factor [Ignavibacteriaceae bacterium]
MTKQILNRDKLNYINFTQKELEELFALSRNGDSNSFQTLSGYVRDISYSYFLSKHRHGKITNKDDVDDLTNNVYLAFAEQYHKIENLEFWLRRVLFLNFINWYKKNNAQRTLQLDEAFYIEHKGVNPEDTLDAEKILKILGTLSEEKQKILKMRFWEDLKFAEIAEKVGKTEDAVKKMFYRTIEELKNKI